MSSSKIDTLKEMIDDDPKDAFAHFMLANELYKEGRYQETVEHLEIYLKLKLDEGPAYRILGDCLLKLGQEKEAQWVFRQGAAAARSHGHLSMAEEFEEKLKEMAAG
jgi:tetratricopeptide (TPR) repeat protein